ncbi:DNA polymerase III subunit delta, partial [candidate division KSB1 bacterium]
MAYDRLQDIKRIITGLESGSLRQCYFIEGSEEYLRRRAVEAVILKVRNTSDEEVQTIKIFGDEADADQLDVTLMSYSLFAEKNIIIIKAARRISASCWKTIGNFINSSSDMNILVLEDEKFDGRNKVVADAKKQKMIISFPELYDTDYLRWIKSYAKKSGFVFSDEAAQYLRDSTEPKLSNYVQEFQKLELFISENENVTLDKIEQLTKNTRTFNIFDFTDALFERKKTLSIELMNQVFTYNESVPGVIVMIVRHIVNLLKIKLLNAEVSANPRKFGM